MKQTHPIEKATRIVIATVFVITTMHHDGFFGTVEQYIDSLTDKIYEAKQNLDTAKNLLKQPA